MNKAFHFPQKARLIVALLAIATLAMLALAWPLSRMSDNPRETADAFIEAVRRQDAATFTRLMETAEYRYVPEAGDQVYFDPWSGKEPNLAFLAESPFTATLLRQTKPQAGGICFRPVACPEGAFFEYRLEFSNNPPLYFLPEWLALRNDRPMPAERYHEFLIDPGKLPTYFTFRVRSSISPPSHRTAHPTRSISIPPGPPGSAPIVSGPMSGSLLLPSPKPAGRVEGLDNEELVKTLPRLKNVVFQIQTYRHSQLEPWKVSLFDFGRATVAVNGRESTFEILSAFSGTHYE